MALSFLLRASLVIGALSYLALEKGRPDPRTAVGAATEAAAGAVSGAVATVAGAALAHAAAARPHAPSDRVPEALPAALAAVPSQAAREALAGLVRRAGQAVPEVQDPPSRDTLMAADRAPPWRGSEAR